MPKHFIISQGTYVNAYLHSYLTIAEWIILSRVNSFYREQLNSNAIRSEINKRMENILASMGLNIDQVGKHLQSSCIMETVENDDQSIPSVGVITGSFMIHILHQDIPFDDIDIVIQSPGMYVYSDIEEYLWDISVHTKYIENEYQEHSKSDSSQTKKRGKIGINCVKNYYKIKSENIDKYTSDDIRILKGLNTISEFDLQPEGKRFSDERRDERRDELIPEILNESHKLQTICIKDNPRDHIINTYDFDIVKNYWDGKKFYFYDLENLLYKNMYTNISHYTWIDKEKCLWYIQLK